MSSTRTSVSGSAAAALTRLVGLDPDAVRCPYPVFAEMREQRPVLWSPDLEAYVVTRHDLIVGVLRDDVGFSSRMSTIGPVGDRQLRTALKGLVTVDEEARGIVERRAQLGKSPVLALADEPQHGRQRKLVNRAFRPAAVRDLEPSIRGHAEELADALLGRPTVDLVHDFAVPLPMTVIATALGVDRARMDDFKRWSDGIAGGFGVVEADPSSMARIVRTRAELEAYLLQVIDEREGDPQEDLISSILHSRVDGQRLSRHECLEMIVQFLIAGNETTTKLICAAVARLATDPDLTTRLREDPEAIEAYVDEALRLEPPVNGLYRVATNDCEIGGERIPAGSAVWLVFAAANRDPAVFADGDKCVIERSETSRNLGFGLGAHFCLGANLARAEVRIALETLLARFSEIALAGDIEYEPSMLMHGIRCLPLRLTSITNTTRTSGG